MIDNHDEQELEALLASTPPPVADNNLSQRVVGVAKKQVKTRDVLILTLLRIWQPLLMLSALSIRWWAQKSAATDGQDTALAGEHHGNT